MLGKNVILQDILFILVRTSRYMLILSSMNIILEKWRIIVAKVLIQFIMKTQ